MIMVLTMLFSMTTCAAVTEISFGEKVNIRNYVTEGKVNIFDFFSEYCPPCMAIATVMEQLDATDNVVVIKVNINRPGVNGIDWTSPVVKQYGLSSVPYFIVVNEEGKQLDENDSRKVTAELIEKMQSEATAKNISESEEGWKTYNHDLYTFNFPDTWKATQQNVMGNELVFIHAPEIFNKTPFKNNINIVVQEKNAQMYDLDSYVKLSEEQMKGFVQDCKFLQNKRISGDDGEVHRLVYSGNIQGNPLAFIADVRFDGNKFFLITLSASRESFKEIKEEANQIFKSFKLK